MDATCFNGPDIMAVAWIPYFPSLNSMPTGHEYPMSLANYLLFNSGNETPPTTFSDFKDFATWFYPSHPEGTRAYRAIVYVRDVTLRYTDGDPFPKIAYESDGYIGFTPPRLIVSGVNLSPLPYQQGIGTKGPVGEEVLERNNGVRLTLRVELKLSPACDMAARLVSGYWAPYAALQLVYTFNKLGDVVVSIGSSSIPSIALYANWKRVWDRDMLRNSKGEIDGFMNSTPGCSLAPEFTYYNYNTVGTPC
jgi:hypothetical protein